MKIEEIRENEKDLKVAGNLEIVYKELEHLKEPDYNPRKLKADQRAAIKESIHNYGFVQPLVVNIHQGRENIVVGGSQRAKIAKSMGYKSVPCVEVDLDEESEKELNLRLNKNQAEFDFDALREYFETDMLLAVGFSKKEIGGILSEFDEEFYSADDSNCEMPIVQEYNESYNMVIVFCKNDLDLNWLKNVLDLKNHRSYKNSNVAMSYVIGVEDFQKAWEKNK